MGNTYSLFFPPKPQLTEENLPSQNGRVFIVTGGYSGIGYDLCRMLYQAGGTVYLAGRSREQGESAVTKIEEQLPDSSGRLVYLPVSLDDLASVKAAAEEFLAKESRLDVLFNNAGVSNPPAGSVSAQGHELQMATNCFGPYLLTQLLVPILVATAKTLPPASVRVVFTSSIVTDLSVPTGGLSISDLMTVSQDQQVNYTNSKTGNWFLASALASQVGSQGVLSVTQNPGNLKTPLLRHMPWYVGFFTSPLLYHPKFGAYTELWAGLSPSLQIEDGGKFIWPWGCFHPSPRADLLSALKGKDEGGTGVAADFAEYCERIVSDYK
ncbi:light induced alcohol dehydrogenase bli-4 [Fusarium albosuccineum]|uniref:Light induced alcohol dehydrogenase bli-4 n=1 Tax=Fusarium albosuccineum TaxID=1237068 RepID=A0A8H4L2B8_9HYPO|nr:light induced alcohol dehydrogenase bli-4 [Fusarium albosuccineum]